MSLPHRLLQSYALTALIAVAIVARIAAAWVWWEDTQTDPDIYVALARQLADGVGFCTPGTANPTAYRPPGYPLLLASLITLPGFQHGLAIPVWNVLFDLATIAFVWSWVRSSSTSVWPACLAAGILTLDPLLLRYTALPMTEPCFTCLSTAAVLLLANAVSWPLVTEGRLERIIWGIAGVLLGMAALCRPSIWPFVGVLVTIYVAQSCWHPSKRRTCRQRVAEMAILCTTLGITIAPWVIRNWWQLGQPILTTTHGGYTLLLANNPVFYDEVARQPWGTIWSHESLTRWQTKMLARMDQELGPAASEIQKDRWQSTQAKQYIAADPAGFAAATWYRLRSFWSLTPRGPAAALPVAVRWGVGLWYAALFVAAIAGGLLLWRRQTPGLWVLLLLIFCLQLVHLVYWTDTRMRLPIHPLLAILAAGVVPERRSSMPTESPHGT